jgi:hypothetical protein
MSTRNPLLSAPPYPVAQSLKQLGGKLTLQALAQKIGTGTRAVMDAERGKASTGIAVYLAMLWALDLLQHMADVAAPEHDDEGQALALAREPQRARAKTGLNNEF